MMLKGKHITNISNPCLSQGVFFIFGTSPSLDQVFQQQQNPLTILFLSSKDLGTKTGHIATLQNPYSQEETQKESLQKPE